MNNLMTPATTENPPKPKSFRITLTQQIMIGLVVGCAVAGGSIVYHPLRRRNGRMGLTLIAMIFLHLIKAMIAPLVFASIVQGIAGTGDMKKSPHWSESAPLL